MKNYYWFSVFISTFYWKKNYYVHFHNGFIFGRSKKYRNHLRWLTSLTVLMNLHLRPSVITWVQSLWFCVIGHLKSAPDRFVFGCKFFPSGAPTNILREKKDKKHNSFQYSMFIVILWKSKKKSRKITPQRYYYYY